MTQLSKFQFYLRGHYDLLFRDMMTNMWG